MHGNLPGEIAAVDYPVGGFLVIFFICSTIKIYLKSTANGQSVTSAERLAGGDITDMHAVNEDHNRVMVVLIIILRLKDTRTDKRRIQIVFPGRIIRVPVLRIALQDLTDAVHPEPHPDGIKRTR